MRQVATRIGTAVLLRVAAAWAWARAQVVGDDHVDFAPDPRVWRIIVGAVIALTVLVTWVGCSRWGGA